VFKGKEDYEVVIDFDVWATDLIRGRAVASEPGFHRTAGRQSRLSMTLEQHRRDGAMGAARHGALWPMSCERLRQTIAAGLTNPYAEWANGIH